MPRPIARVLLDSPLPQLDRLFDYLLPAEWSEAKPGQRVRVPLRTAGRIVDGFIVELASEDDDSRALAAIDTVVSEACVLPERTYTLARRVADRAAGSASDVVRLIVPKRAVRVEKAWLAAEEPARVEHPAPDAAALGTYPGLGDTLSERGRAALEVTAHSDERGRPAWPGVFAAAAAATLAAGESAILVVPDYRDLELLITVLAETIPEELIVRLDARQANPERYRSFLRTLADAPCVVVGNRSAVYAPVRAGLVALWDDGDSLLAEPLSPGIHARDAALVRQELEGSALVFAAHTRSTDVERLVVSGWLRDVRAARRQRPAVSLSSAQELEQDGARLTPSVFRVLREALESGAALVQVARPGFAPTLVCGSCRQAARCTDCGGPLGAARRGAVPTCGWCGKPALRWACGHCAGTTFRLASSGSERTAEELGKAFPGVRIIVADGAHPIDEVGAEAALVIATRGAEPRAIGGYRGVVLLDGARMLQSPQLRVGESCLRWWANAAALAAPGAPVHLVGLDGPLATAFATWSHAEYARGELAARAPLRMPPTARVAQVEGTAKGVARALDAVAEWGLPADAVLGPVPLPPDDKGHSAGVRALVRFDYGQGAQLAQTLRAAVIAEAVGRRGRGARGPRTTLSVRLDVAEPEL